MGSSESPSRRSYSIPSRPTYTLTAEQWDAFLALLQDGYNIASAARKLGFHRQTVYDRIARDPSFGDRVRDHAEAGVDYMEDQMRLKAIEPGGFLPNIAWLKAHRRAKWGDQQQITSSATVKIEFSQVPSASELIAADELMLREIEQLPPPTLRIPANTDNTDEGYE